MKAKVVERGVGWKGRAQMINFQQTSALSLCEALPVTSST